MQRRSTRLHTHARTHARTYARTHARTHALTGTGPARAAASLDKRRRGKATRHSSADRRLRGSTLIMFSLLWAATLAMPWLAAGIDRSYIRMDGWREGGIEVWGGLAAAAAAATRRRARTHAHDRAHIERESDNAAARTKARKTNEPARRRATASRGGHREGTARKKAAAAAEAEAALEKGREVACALGHATQMHTQACRCTRGRLDARTHAP
jgi:hypothetical protein